MKSIYALTVGLLFSIGTFAQSGNPDAIYVWVDGSEVCYRLEASPVVKFIDGSAILWVNDREVLSLNLKERGDLRIVFGQYEESKDPTGIVEVADGDSSLPSKVSHSGKLIRGGRVVVVKDGKMYDMNGVAVKD